MLFCLREMDSKALCFITHQAIFNAVRSGDLEGLKELLQKLNKGESSNGSSSISELMSMQNDAGETLLFIAAESGFKEVFSFLIGFCDFEVVKIRSKSDLNAFHVAAKCGHLGIFHFIGFFKFFTCILSLQLGYLFMDFFYRVIGTQYLSPLPVTNLHRGVWPTMCTSFVGTCALPLL